MSEYDFVGVDVSKAKFDVAIDLDKHALGASFENNKAGFKRFMVWLTKHCGTVWVCLEATGCYSEKLAMFLVENDIRVSVVNPMQIKNYAKAILARNKNDRLDAKIIASFAEKFADSLRCFQPRSRAQKYLRDRVQLIDTLKKQQQQLKNQLDSVESPEVKKEYEQIIRSIDKRLTTLEEKINRRIEEDEQLVIIKQRLTSIIGIGEKSANRLLAYLPNIDLFKHAKQLAAYAGVSPKQRQSGTASGKTRISKFGNASLRKALYMPALVAKNNNPHLKGFCQRLEKNGLAPKAIVIAVMRKLLHLIYGMLKHNQDFNPELV